MAQIIFKNDDIRVVSAETVSEGESVVNSFYFERSDGLDSVGEPRWVLIFSLENGELNTYFDPARLSRNTVSALGKAFVEAIGDNE